jgi:hypothetical protein
MLSKSLLTFNFNASINIAMGLGMKSSFRAKVKRFRKSSSMMGNYTLMKRRRQVSWRRLIRLKPIAVLAIAPTPTRVLETAVVDYSVVLNAYYASFDILLYNFTSTVSVVSLIGTFLSLITLSGSRKITFIVPLLILFKISNVIFTKLSLNPIS